MELYTELLQYPAEEKEKLCSALSEDAKNEFEKYKSLVEGIHRRNSHKETYPIDLNVL